jgi:hypothetical protein
MSDLTDRSPVATARSAGEEVVRSSSFEWFSRAGFVARGLIYGIIGVLALKLALGHGGKLTNHQGAFDTVAQQPFGKFLLTVLAVGLGGYALWRFARAALGHGPEGSDSTFDRVAALASGVVYLCLCVIAVQILTGSSQGSGSSTPDKTTASVLGWPAGIWIVGAVGLVLIGVGLYQGYRGISKDFLADAKTEEMSPRTRTWIGRIGLIGHLARMVVFALVGAFFVKAAADYEPRAAIGLDGALAKIQHQPYGPLLLGIVAVGLIAFAIYSFSDARFRRI